MKQQSLSIVDFILIIFRYEIVLQQALCCLIKVAFVAADP